MTVYVYERQGDGSYRLFKALDVKGNLTITWGEGDFLKYEFTGIGSYQPADVATVAGPSLPTVYGAGKAPIKTQGMTVTLAGSPFSLVDLDLNTNWSVEEVRSITGSSSLDQVLLIRPDASPVGGSFNFKSTADFSTVLSARANNTVMALVANASDGVDTIAFNAPSIQLDDWSDDGGNISTYAVPYFAYGQGAGDNDFSLIFT